MKYGFNDTNYKLQKPQGNYMKLQEGDNKFRILSDRIVGWEDWTLEKKPLRFRIDSKPFEPIDPERPIKEFWAMVVWNYAEAKLQILHLTQKSILSEIENLIFDEDWGDPREYDIKIVREKSTGGLVKYSVKPLPHKAAPKEAIASFESKHCNLEALFDGDDPWGIKKPEVQNKAKDVEQRFWGALPDIDVDGIEAYIEYLCRLGNNKYTAVEVMADATNRIDDFVKGYGRWYQESYSQKAAASV